MIELVIQIAVVLVVLVALIAILARSKNIFSNAGGGGTLTGLSAMHDLSTKEKQEAIVQILEQEDRKEEDESGERK